MTLPRDFYAYFGYEADEDIFDTDTVYLYTWAPNPARYPTTKPYEQYRILLDLVLLNADKVFRTFAFSPEMTCNGNVHIHGWYTIKDAVKYFKWWLPKCKQFGFVKVDKMRDKSALEYYKKDIDLMNELMDEYDLPIPLTHVNIDTYKTRPRKKFKKLKNIVHTPQYVSVLDHLKKSK